MQNELDLLQEIPDRRVHLDGLNRALPFAFAAGDTAGVFERALQTAHAPETCLDGDCFSSDLFLDTLLAECLVGTPRGGRSKPCTSYLRRVLSSPPKDPQVTHFRQETFKELEQPEHRSAFEQIYRALRQLRDWLDGDGLTVRPDMVQRRLDILRTFRDALKLMSASFGKCTSALARLSQFGQKATATSAFTQLEELLSYESNLASLDLRVQVGIDGRIRDFQVVSLQENEHNPYHSHWLVRLWTRLRLMLRGYPLREQELIVRLTDAVFDALRPSLLPLFQLVGDMEFYLAGLRLRDRAAEHGLLTSFAEFHDPGSRGGVELIGLFNPFLLTQGPKVVACDIRTESGSAMTIVTGPNSGGKTRLLQAVALTQLLGQCGLPVPAQRAQLHWTQGLFVSIVSEVSANQSEGRLGMELLRIRKLFEGIRPGAVVMLDELCSGTNPSEGEEIFRLVLELLSELGTQLWLSTHFLSLAQELERTRPVPHLEFSQVELSPDQLPTYRFKPGVAETSLAGRTASRLGVTRAELAELVAQAKLR